MGFSPFLLCPENPYSERILVEDYPDDYPMPSGLVLGYTENNRPLHGVAVLSEESSLIWVITIYEPSIADWNEGFKERRTKDAMPFM
jgi:hypothetical protein